MSVFELIKDQMTKTVPFARHTGVVLEEVGEGRAAAKLDQRQETSNHLGSQHAGALFTLGEAASGGAMAGGFAEKILEIQPIAGEASIAYIKVAKGVVRAEATIEGSPEALRAELRNDGKTRFQVAVTMKDESGDEVANMKVTWHVRERRS